MGVAGFEVAGSRSRTLQVGLLEVLRALLVSAGARQDQ